VATYPHPGRTPECFHAKVFIRDRTDTETRLITAERKVNARLSAGVLECSPFRLLTLGT